MNDLRPDAELVTTYLGGDQSALAAIYDRYADRLYDAAAGMLRDQHEAADVVHDLFIVVSQRLGQLREPERLRAWLFAILRHEVYRRTRRRARDRPVDFGSDAGRMMGAIDESFDGTERRAVEELAALVRTAASGLDDRDQLILELTAREGLEGRDLADALGVDQQQCHVLVHRMRQRVARSLGAVTVARMGAEDCGDLATILSGWDGTFTVQIRKRVARHVDGCETCQSTSRRFAALPLMAAAPAFAAPAGLRDRVLDTAGAAPAPDVRFTADGFPAAGGRSGSRALLVRAVGIAAAVSIMAGGVALVAWRGSNERAETSAVATTSATSLAIADETAGATVAQPTGPATTAITVSTAAASSTSTTSTTSTPPTTALDPGPTGETAPPPPPPPAGELTLSNETVDLGADEESNSVELRNVGGQPVDWQLSGDSQPFLWSATSGTLGPGETLEVFVGIDRAALPEGDVVATFVVETSAGGSSSVSVTAAVERAPDVDVARAVTTTRCPWSVDPLVAALVTDESPLASVRLAWSGPGAPGEVDMEDLGSGQFRARLSIEQVSGTWTWSVTATDSRGNSRSVSRDLVVIGRC